MSTNSYLTRPSLMRRWIHICDFLCTNAISNSVIIKSQTHHKQRLSLSLQLVGACTLLQFHLCLSIEYKIKDICVLLAMWGMNVIWSQQLWFVFKFVHCFSFLPFKYRGAGTHQTHQCWFFVYEDTTTIQCHISSASSDTCDAPTTLPNCLFNHSLNLIWSHTYIRLP